MNHFMPVRMFTSDHCIEKNKSLFPHFGRRCAVITGKSSAEKSGALTDVRGVLDACGILFRVYDGISQNPTVESCRQAGCFAHEFGADFIIGIGGGSALDAAKAAAVFAANPELDEDAFYQKAWKTAPLPIVLVGTTAGTGSEVTKVSVLTDNRGRKHSIHDDRIFATAAFGDPRYTMSLPRSVTLSTGIDVLSHCAESYFSKKADEISRAFAVRGIRLLYEPLLAAASGTEPDPEQRAQLYDASILGGLAICGTGTCFPHNVGYYLTETCGIPHGYASALFLPDLLALVREKDADYYARFLCETVIPESDLLRLISTCLPDHGICMTEEQILTVLPRWENNNSVLNTCCPVSTDEIRKVLEDKFLHRERSSSC